MIRVRISTRAANYLRSEREYLSKFSEGAAAQFALHLRAARRTLSEYPEAGVQTTPSSEIRSLVFLQYVLEYERHGDEVVILLVRHGRQQRTVLTEDEEDFSSDV